MTQRQPAIDPIPQQNSVLLQGIKFQHLIKIVWETKTQLAGNVKNKQSTLAFRLLLFYRQIIRRK